MNENGLLGLEIAGDRLIRSGRERLVIHYEIEELPPVLADRRSDRVGWDDTLLDRQDRIRSVNDLNLTIMDLILNLHWNKSRFGLVRHCLIKA